MIVNLSIPTPVLSGTQYFRVRYRLAGVTMWTNAPNQTNASFTLNLPAGDYEIEFSLADTGGLLCPATIQTFTVIDTTADDPCLDFEPAIEPDGRGYKMVISYSGTTSPLVCGYEVRLIRNGFPTEVRVFQPLPASPLTISPVANAAYQVNFVALLCNGRQVQCATVDVPAGTPLCEPSTLTAVEITFGGGMTFLRFTFTQSNPYTASFGIVYSQTDMVTSGIPDPGGNVTLPAQPTTTQIFQPISPNYAVPPQNGIQTVHYAGNFIDGCGTTQPWMASFDLT